MPQTTTELPDSISTLGTRYEDDISAWATEQSAPLRARRFDAVDIEHIAEVIDDVGKSEQRELASRVALLLSHPLKWQLQPERRGASWLLTIRNQRRGIARRLRETPSLRPRLQDTDWLQGAWDDAVAKAAAETGPAEFLDHCPWTQEQLLSESWLP